MIFHRKAAVAANVNAVAAAGPAGRERPRKCGAWSMAATTRRGLRNAETTNALQDGILKRPYEPGRIHQLAEGTHAHAMAVQFAEAGRVSGAVNRNLMQKRMSRI
jgi:hypothetical protein